jgi:hypothetical protein
MIGVKGMHEGKFSTTPEEMYFEDYLGEQYMSPGLLPPESNRGLIYRMIAKK